MSGFGNEVGHDSERRLPIKTYLGRILFSGGTSNTRTRGDALPIAFGLEIDAVVTRRQPYRSKIWSSSQSRPAAEAFGHRAIDVLDAHPKDLPGRRSPGALSANRAASLCTLLSSYDQARRAIRQTLKTCEVMSVGAAQVLGSICHIGAALMLEE